MFRGTIMFFSDGDSVAHIWCADAENPLFRARREDFADSWPRLKVGDVVDVQGTACGGAQFARALHVVAGEDV